MKPNPDRYVMPAISALLCLPFIFFSAFQAAAAPAAIAAGPATEGGFNDLKTFCTIGKEVHPLSKEKEAVLLSHEGKGCLTHMWFGGAFRGYQQTRIRVYVDGEEKAGIDMELFMGIGVGFGDTAGPWGVTRFGNTGGDSGIYNTYRIPFGKSIRVTAQLAPDADPNPVFWWIIRGTENLATEVAGIRLPEGARLRLHKLENYHAKRLEEFALCDVPGSGLLYQTTIAGKSTRNLNFLEACMRAYSDGAKEPVLLSSGLEDYFLGTYYFKAGRYHNAVAGLTHLDSGKQEFSAYRFHDDDPIVYHNGFRLTCRCGEEIEGKVFGDPADTDYTTYVWTYEW